MKQEVNLLPKKLGKIRKKQKLKFLLTRVLMGLVLVLALVMVGLSSYSLVLAKGNKNLEEKTEQVKKKISSLSEIESKQVYLLSKLGSFESLIKTQETHQAVTETVFALIPNGTTLKGFQVSEDGVIQISGSVPNYLVLSELLDRARSSLNYRLPILKAVATRVTVGNEGVINFDIDLTVGVKES